jgi:hypothetical protein
MKNLFFILSLAVVTNILSAQEKQLPIVEIIDKIKQLDLFVQYGRFRDSTENELKLIANGAKISSDDYKKLYLACDSLRLRYNRFLELISSDLSKSSQIKAIRNNPDIFASKYMEEYESVLTYYSSSYKKTYNDVENNVRKSNGGLSTKLQNAGSILTIKNKSRPFIKKTLGWIKQRRDEGEESKNTIIAALTEHFVKPLAMKPWKLLVENNTLSVSEIASLKKEQRKSYIENSDLTIIENSEFKGYLYFNYCDKDCDKPELSDVKRIEFENQPITKGNVKPGYYAFLGDLRYISVNKFSTGFMQLNFNSKAVVNVFAYNSEKDKIRSIFPFSVSELKEKGYCDEYIGTKSLNVSPFFRSSTNGSLTILAVAKEGKNEIPMFMNVSSDSEMEYIVALISNKQLPEGFYQDLEDDDGNNLEIRLHNILGRQLISSSSQASIINNNGLISFDATSLYKGHVISVYFCC